MLYIFNLEWFQSSEVNFVLFWMQNWNMYIHSAGNSICVPTKSVNSLSRLEDNFNMCITNFIIFNFYTFITRHLGFICELNFCWFTSLAQNSNMLWGPTPEVWKNSSTAGQFDFFCIFFCERSESLKILFIERRTVKVRTLVFNN